MTGERGGAGPPSSRGSEGGMGGDTTLLHFLHSTLQIDTPRFGRWCTEGRCHHWGCGDSQGKDEDPEEDAEGEVVDGEANQLAGDEWTVGADAQGVRDAQQQDGHAQVSHTVFGFPRHAQLPAKTPPKLDLFINWAQH